MKTTVYTITDCPFCKQEKDFLTAQGIQFEEKNVQENRQFLTEMLEVSNKFAGVPFTLVEKDSGEKVSLRGFTQSEFEEALGKTPTSPMSSAQAEAPAPVVPALDTPLPDMPKTDMQMGDIPGSTPSSMPDATPNMPSMPGIDEMPNMSTTPATPVAPVDPVAAPAPMAPAPMAPDPMTPAMPADSSAPANPQSQLDGLLADLQTKAQPDIPEFPSQAPQGTATQHQ